MEWVKESNDKRETEQVLDKKSEKRIDARVELDCWGVRMVGWLKKTFLIHSGEICIKNWKAQEDRELYYNL